jgi:diaminopimelate epimerase
MRFSKAHAYGNDFLYVEASIVVRARLDALAREMCDRHTGAGADGLIVYSVMPPGARHVPGTEPLRATMTLFNADGGRAEVSGNGVRGLAALLLRDENREKASVTIETDAGPKQLTRISRAADSVPSVPGTCLAPTDRQSPTGRQTFRAAMGLPRDVRQLPLTAAGETLTAVVLDFGNPQCIVLGPLPDERRFRTLGAALEHHQMFPAGTNVEFAAVEQPDAVRILIWERGVGPTMSSGTGSCAALVAAASFGGAAREADVIAPGGAQRVNWTDENVFLTGWAEVVFDGEWCRQIPRTP